MAYRQTGAAAAVTILLAFGAGPAAAGPFSADYVFGDSLSDRGNLAAVLGHNFPSPPFFHDSFTNGPTAVQVMAQRLGLNADPSLFVTGFKNAIGYTAGGSNYAVAGATAGNSIPTNGNNTQGVGGANLGNQIGAFLALKGSVAPADALYTVFIGGNDVRTAAKQLKTSYLTDGISAETAGIGALIAAGAKTVLVVNVPDVGLIPEFTQSTRPNAVAEGKAAHDDSISYNQALASSVISIAASSPGVNIKLFDLFSFNNTYIANAASVGITNTTDACYTNYDGVLNTPATFLKINPACGAIDPATGQAANIGQFQYWDTIHPTAKVQAAFGNALYDFAVPEPASMALLSVGIAAIGLMRRRAA